MPLSELKNAGKREDVILLKIEKKMGEGWMKRKHKKKRRVVERYP